MLACGVHGTSNTTRANRTGGTRTRTIRRSTRSTRTGPFKDRFAALHASQRLRRSFRSFVDRARSCLRHNHALGGRLRNSGAYSADRFRSCRDIYRHYFCLRTSIRCCTFLFPRCRHVRCGMRWGCWHTAGWPCNRRSAGAIRQAAGSGFLHRLFRRGRTRCPGHNRRRFHNDRSGWRTRSNSGSRRRCVNNLRSLSGLRNNSARSRRSSGRNGNRGSRVSRSFRRGWRCRRRSGFRRGGCRSKRSSYCGLLSRRRSATDTAACFPLFFLLLDGPQNIAGFRNI